jgi:hypothetical protein
MLTPLNVVGLEGWIRRYAKSEKSPYVFWGSLLDMLPHGVEADDPRVVALLLKYNVALESKPADLRRRPAEPVERHRLAGLELPPAYLTWPLTKLEMEMLEGAETRTLRRAGWQVTIDGRKASVVTLKRLQDRQLIRHVKLTEEGWYWSSGDRRPRPQCTKARACKGNSSSSA